MKAEDSDSLAEGYLLLLDFPSYIVRKAGGGLLPLYRYWIPGIRQWLLGREGTSKGRQELNKRKVQGNS